MMASWSYLNALIEQDLAFDPEREMAQTIEASAAKFRTSFSSLKSEIGKVIVGHEGVVQDVLICLFAGGHVLLEGVPGLGKTMLVSTLSQTLHLRFSRIQFTPDLMPADIIGTNVVVENERGQKFVEFQKGPLFANIILADEINRATPKTQSALLEAMQERSVTVGGVRHDLEAPFFVLATQNPIEMEGTYPLPEAQLDRFFFKLKIQYPKMGEAMEILRRTTQREMPQAGHVLDAQGVRELSLILRDIPVATHVQEYALKVLYGTHPTSPHATEMTKRFVKYGASPRGAQAMVLAGKALAILDNRFNVSEHDIRQAALPSLRHRIILNFEGEAEGMDTDAIINDVIRHIQAGKQ